MLNLIFLINIVIIFIIFILIINNIKCKINKVETNMIKQVISLEENKHFIPFVLMKYYSHIINIKSELTPYLITTSYWYDTMEYIKEKVLKVNNVLIIQILKKLGLLLSIVLYGSILLFWFKYKRNVLGYQELVNIGSDNSIWNLNISLGLDGLSLPFIALIGFIFPIVYISNWSTIDKFNIYYIILIISIELFLIIVFLVIDFIMFYVFFESILPPLFVLIGLYGAAQKFRAGYYFFLYTLIGSLFMLLTFVKMGGDLASSFFESYGNHNVFTTLQIIIWIILFFSLSVKTPLVPVHIWLPLAHSDANVSGSIILASVVLKLALYGFIRILIGIFFLGTIKLTPFFLGFCSMSVLYSSFTTTRQFDLKVLVAYSSIAHMASSLLGTFSDTLYGLIGSIIFGLAHGFVSPGLFIVVGAILYDRCGSRIINYYRGLNALLPVLALLFLFLTFANMSVPLTGNFIGEFLSLLGTYQQNIFIASISALSIIISAVYSIFMFNRVMSGSLSPYIHNIPDIFRKEYFALFPLIVLTLLLGIYPYFISSDIEFALSNFLFGGSDKFIGILGAVSMERKKDSEEEESNSLVESSTQIGSSSQSQSPSQSPSPSQSQSQSQSNTQAESSAEHHNNTTLDLEDSMTICSDISNSSTQVAPSHISSPATVDSGPTVVGIGTNFHESLLDENGNPLDTAYDEGHSILNNPHNTPVVNTVLPSSLNNNNNNSNNSNNSENESDFNPSISNNNRDVGLPSSPEGNSRFVSLTDPENQPVDGEDLNFRIQVWAPHHPNADISRTPALWRDEDSYSNNNTEDNNNNNQNENKSSNSNDTGDLEIQSNNISQNENINQTDGNSISENNNPNPNIHNNNNNSDNSLNQEQIENDVNNISDTNDSNNNDNNNDNNSNNENNSSSNNGNQNDEDNEINLSSNNIDSNLSNNNNISRNVIIDNSNMSNEIHYSLDNIDIDKQSGCLVGFKNLEEEIASSYYVDFFNENNKVILIKYEDIYNNITVRSNAEKKENSNIEYKDKDILSSEIKTHGEESTLNKESLPYEKNNLRIVDNLKEKEPQSLSHNELNPLNINKSHLIEGNKKESIVVDEEEINKLFFQWDKNLNKSIYENTKLNIFNFDPSEDFWTLTISTQTISEFIKVITVIVPDCSDLSFFYLLFIVYKTFICILSLLFYYFNIQTRFKLILFSINIYCYPWLLTFIHKIKILFFKEKNKIN